MLNNDFPKPRKRIIVLSDPAGDASVITEALDNGTFDLRFVSDLPQLAKSVLELKPALFLLKIDSWRKQTRELLYQLGNLKSTQPFRRVILAEAATVDDRVSALELGADDFLVKPISSRELVARLQAVLRSDISFAAEEEVRSFGFTLSLQGADGGFHRSGSKETQSHRVQLALLLYGPPGAGLESGPTTGKRLDSLGDRGSSSSGRVRAASSRKD